LAKFLRDELFASNEGHGGEHAGVRNAATTQLFFDHFGALDSEVFFARWVGLWVDRFVIAE
jgi:hypothetical protein